MEQVTIQPFSNEIRAKIIRMIFASTLLLEGYLFYSKTFLHQLQQPVFRFLDFDITHWIFHFSHLPQWITQHTIIASLFDFTLIGLTILCILFPLNRKWIISFFCSWFVYLITRNAYGMFHEHLFYGVLFVTMPFLFKSNLTAKYLWEFARYIQYFIYFSAFLWKFCRWHFMSYNHFTTIFKYNLSSFMYMNPDSTLTSFYKFILPHTDFLYFIGMVGLILEGIYIIGFFTKKYDTFFFFLGFFMHFFFWFFVDAFLFPILILNLTLLKFRSNETNNKG